MQPVSLVSVAVAVLVSSCSGAARPAAQKSVQPPPSPAATAAPTERATPTATPRVKVSHPAPTDEVPPGLLAAIRTRHYASHDRIVFQFHGRQTPPTVIRYVDKVTADPSDRPVRLRGHAFVSVVFQGGTLDTAATESDPSRARHYRGPTRLTPLYPRLQEVAGSGDFEAVLSFGLGLSAVSGLSTSVPPGSGSLVLDVWRTAPGTLLWPVTSAKAARDLQTATESGHQPWVLSAPEVATSYVEHVLGWSHPTVQQLSARVFQAATGTRSAVLTLSQPLARPDTVWAVASVVRSKG